MAEKPSRRVPEPYWALGIALTFLALYVLTLVPGVVGGDSGELQFVPHVLGIPHQTGYPLFVLLGKLWTTVFRLGSIAYRMNLLSALFGAATLGMVYAVARELGTGRGAALLSAAALGTSPLFWELSTVAGVRTLNTLFFLAILLLALGWRRSDAPPKEADKLLALLALTAGLALAHHRSVILLLPAVLLYLALAKWPFWSSGRELLKLAILAVAPLALYLYLPIRGAMDPPYAWRRADTLEGFLELAVAGTAQGNLHWIARPELPARLGTFAALVLRQLTPSGAALALWGGVVLAHRDLKHFLLVALPLAGVSALTLGWIPSPGKLNPVFIAPALPLFALAFGLGLDFLLGLASRARKGAGALGVAGFSLFLLLEGYQGGANLKYLLAKRGAPLDNFRQEMSAGSAEAFAWASFHWAESGATIVSDWEQGTPLLYYQLVEGRRPDLKIVGPMDTWPERLDSARAEGKRLYLARALPALYGHPYLSNAGPLVEMREGPELELPDGLSRTGIRLEDKLELVGYALLGRDGTVLTPAPAFRRGENLRILLYWRALPGLEKDYSLSLRLVDGAGKAQAQRDGVHPVLALYPTSLWEDEETVADYYELPLKWSLRPGNYHLELRVYRHLGGDQWENLQVEGATPGTREVRLISLEIG